jgi:uncharacterized protein (DUF2336 family)
MAKYDPRLDGLFDLASREGVDIRPTLLRVLTDLYVQKSFHTREEETQYAELATGLIDAVDAATRECVRARLRDYPAAPAAVVCKLSVDAPFPQPAAPKGDDLVELFFSAASDERRLILSNLVGSDGIRFAPASPERLARLEAAAMQRNASEFARLLRAPLHIAAHLADRIVQDASGEALVVAMKALGMGAPALQRVLLFLNPMIGNSVARVYELSALFDELSPEAATQMVALWRDAAPTASAQTERPRKAAYEPATAEDERRSARSFATHGARRMPRIPSSPLTPAKAGVQGGSAALKGPAGLPSLRE